MRLAKGTAWILGGAAVAAAGLMLGAWLGPTGAGAGAALVGMVAGLLMVEQGMETW